MPIFHKTEKKHYDWKNNETTTVYREGETSHVGKVIRIGVDHSVKIMSDVWADESYALVWDDELQEPRKYSLGIHDSICPIHDTAEVDATPDILAKLEAHEDRQELIRQERERIREIGELRFAHNRVERGKRMKVVRGRKVPKGTTGVVFWLGVDNWGNTKAGIALSDERDSRERYSDVAWVNAGYLVPCDEFQVPDYLSTPVCDLEETKNKAA